MNYKFQIDNQNKKDYIENIKSHFLDNLRHLPFAPSVQMNDVPPDVLTFDDYGEEEEKNQDTTKIIELLIIIIGTIIKSFFRPGPPKLVNNVS